MIQRVRLVDLPWAVVLCAVMLSTAGLLLVTSATWNDDAAWGMGNEARMQLVWWAIALIAGAITAHLRFAAWKDLAWTGYGAAILLLVIMVLAAGTPLVPKIKGQANWIALGSLRIQPVEFIKIATLLALARLCAAPWFDARKLSHALLAIAVGLGPAVLVAKEDLGSALTFPPMVVGVLLICGLRLRLVALGALLALSAAAVGVATLPKDGYQWKRVQAWLDPEAYALAEGYQTTRSLRSIGSGRVFGKGFAAGDQNRLGWVPEKHTDLILAVAGEETGFLGTSALVLLLFLFGLGCLWTAGNLKDPAARLVPAGFGCLVVGQAAINLAVATGMMPVTGVTLPFISYGGSSLLALHLGIGLITSACAEQGRQPRPNLLRPIWAR